MYLYGLMGRFHLTGHILEQGCQTRVVLRLTRSVGRTHHHHRPLHIGREDVTFILFETLFARGSLQLTDDGLKQVERVALHMIGQHTASRQHQHLLILLQLGAYIVGLTYQRVHPRIVGCSQEIRDMLIHEGRHRLHLLEIHLRHQVVHHVAGVALFECSSKRLDGLNHHVGIGLRRVAIREQGEQAVGTRYVLIDLQRMLVAAVEGQEVGDILLVAESHH